VESTHSTHARVTIEAGLARLKDEIGNFKEMAYRAVDMYEKEVHQISRFDKQLSMLEQSCSDHFYRVVDILRKQLDTIKTKLESTRSDYRSQCAELVTKLNNAKAVHHVSSRAISELGLSNLEEYMNLRPALVEAVRQIQNVSTGLEVGIESFSIDAASSTESSDPVPRISLHTPENMTLFTIVESPANADSRRQRTKQRKTLHRTTSNDKLNT
jgi:hypothetical protein